MAEVGDEDPEVRGEAEQSSGSGDLKELVVGFVYYLFAEEGSQVLAFVPLEGFGEVVWVCPGFTDCLSLSHSASSQSNLFVL